MANFFDEAEWRTIITEPDWYIKLYPKLSSMRKQWEAAPDNKQMQALKREVRGFFEAVLLNDELNLAYNGPNLDKERQPINTIVVHHTSAKPGYSLSNMNAVQLLNIYMRAYSDPAIRTERKLHGSSIWSGHFLPSGKPSFLCYHWLMRMDGRFERLLNDQQIGWHSGNWEVNKRSIGICLDNDYEHQDPSDEILQILAQHIKQHYSFVKTGNIIGHCEARKGTICPGGNFINGWKPKLLSLLYE